VGLLNGLGYTNVRHYHGGLNDWMQHGHAIESAPAGDADAGTPPTVARAAAGRAGGASSKASERMIAVIDWFAQWPLSSLLLAWLATVLGCGAIYWAAGFIGRPALLAAGIPVPLDAGGLLTAIYFSFITAASVGYGDVVPMGWVRMVAIAEGVTALFVFGLFVSKFVSRRQDRLIEEIHLTTFEDRLDRVQTSLHLVLTELQAIAATCQRRDWPRDRLLARIQSAAAIFTGQLRTVHGLLYRPLRTPEEDVLEGILAGLASGLEAFGELLQHLPAREDRPASLERSLEAMALVAREICSECVPRSYAPELKGWMDRVQQLAGALTAARDNGHGRA
jgi:potassium channel LctB